VGKVLPTRIDTDSDRSGGYGPDPARTDRVGSLVRGLLQPSGVIGRADLAGGPGKKPQGPKTPPGRWVPYVLPVSVRDIRGKGIGKVGAGGLAAIGVPQNSGEGE